jgi:hypothetical protein
MKQLTLLIIILFLFTKCQTKEDNSAKINIAVDKYFELRQNIPKYEVMLMGVFHTDYPNNDKFTTDTENQIDILSPQRQKEVEILVKSLALSKPTKIFVEWQIENQKTLDSLYIEYVAGKHQTQKSEIFQIGMRLAKKLGHSKIFAADSYAVEYTVPKTDSSIINKKFQTLKITEIDEKFEAEKIYLKWFEEYQRNITLTEIFTILNKTSFTDNDMVATYFDSDNQPFGSDQFPTGWHNRNIRIFSNIKRHLKPNDKAFVIYGGAHIPILKHLFESSIQFKVSRFGIDK